MNKEQFFLAYFAHLDVVKCDYIILHNYKDYPQEFASDIDYCVCETQVETVLKLLYAFCKKNNWQLVQILQHEINAYYCVCVSAESPLECLKLDVCGDYVREGKKLIDSKQLLDSSIMTKAGFRIPSVKNEFHYILWKTVAKAKKLDATRDRLIELYNSNKINCNDVFRVMGIANNSIEEMLEIAYANLSIAYSKLPLRNRFREFKRYAGRLISPSGLILEISDVRNGGNQKTIEIMINYLANSFRAHLLVENRGMDVSDMKLALRSSLIVYDDNSIRRCAKWILDSRDCYLKLSIRSAKEMTREINDYMSHRVRKRWKLDKEF